MRTVGDRFFAKVDASGACWEWTGAMSNNYGSFRFKGQARTAHRVCWELLVGDIPAVLDNGKRAVLDHLCRNKRCVNPDHMEIVDDSTNVGRSRPPIALTCRACGAPRAPRAACRPCNARRYGDWYGRNRELALERARLSAGKKRAA